MHLLRDLFFIAAKLVIACILVLAAACSREPEFLRFKVSFADSDGLQVGHPIICMGQQVGMVEKIELSPGKVLVQTKVAKDHANIVFKESDFQIVNPDGFLSNSSARALNVDTAANGSHSPIAPLEELRGRDSLRVKAELAGKRLQEHGAEYAMQGVSKLATFTLEMYNRWQAYKNTREGKEFLATVNDYARRAANATGREAEQLKRDVLPLLFEKADRLKDRLIEMGKTKEAAAFASEFLDWSKTVKADDQSTTTGS